MEEMIDAAGEFETEKLAELVNRMYDTGYMKEKMIENLFITIPKKPSTV